MAQYNQGPGPNAYNLPPLTGYPKHDISKWRNPAYSMGVRTSLAGKGVGPGPVYRMEDMTRYGKAYSPAAPFGMRTELRGKDTGPGPSAYNPDPRNIGRVRHEGGTFGGRPDPISKAVGPGPNAYDVSRNPTKKRTPAFAIGTRTEMPDKHFGPGPNAYCPKRTDKVKTVKFGPPPAPHAVRDSGPGPGAYQSPQMLRYNSKANPPKVAFGVRTNNAPYISPEDNAQCELICRRG